MNPITNSIAAVTRLFGAFDAAIHRDGLNSVMYVSRFSAGLGKQLAAFDLAVRYLWPATGQPGGQPYRSHTPAGADFGRQWAHAYAASNHRASTYKRHTVGGITLHLASSE